MPKISTFLGHVLPESSGSIAFGYGAEGPETTKFVSSAELLIANIGAEFGKDCYYTPARYRRQDDGKFKRKAVNCSGKRCFAIDVDLNHEKKPSYSTKEEAIVASYHAFAHIGLPAPSYVVDSGGGLHIYWALDSDVPPEIWKPMAEALKTAWKDADLKLACDTTRISDLAGYLRLPGSMNTKHQALCQFYELNGAHAGVETVYPLSAFNTLGAPKRRSVALTGAPKRRMKLDRVGGSSPDLNDPHESTEITRPAELVHECRPLEKLAEGDQSYEAWQGLARLYARAGESGRDAYHIVSSSYKGYSFDETDKKFTDALNTSFASPSCAQLRAWAGLSIDACRSCPLFQAQGEGGKPAALQSEFIDPVKSRNVAPASLDNEVEALAQARLALHNGSWAPLDRLGITVPKRMMKKPKGDFPGIYIDEETGFLSAKAAIKVGKEEVMEEFVISRTPFWVDSLLAEKNHDSSSPKFGARLVQVRKREDTWEGRYVTTPSKDINGSAQILLQCLKSYGLGVSLSKPTHPAMSVLHNYLSRASAGYDIERAYHQEDNFGWRHLDIPEARAFVIGDRRYTAGGTTVLVEQGPGARELNYKVPQVGSLEEAKRISNRAMADGKFPLQFMMLCAMGAPLMHMTNVEGAVVAVSGATGKGKSAAMSYACGFYGTSRPGGLTATGVDTQKSIMHMIGMMSNLPVFIDETTSMDDDTVASTLLQITQGGENNRLEASANKLRERNRWQTIAIASANKSLAAAITQESYVAEAQRMRAIDIDIEDMDEPFYSKGSNAFLDEVLIPSHMNHGLLGVEFIKYVLNNYDTVKDMIVKTESHLRRGKTKFAATNNADPMRVWRGVIAVAAVTAAIGNNLGFWTMSSNFTDHLVTRLTEAARTIEDRSSTDPAEYVHRFLAAHQNAITIDAVTTREGNTLTGSALADKERVMSIDGRKPLSHSPMWATVARLTLQEGERGAICEVSTSAFKKFCSANEIDYEYACQRMLKAGLLVDAKGRTQLGRGAPLPSAHSTVSSIGGEALPPTRTLSIKLRLSRPYEMGHPPEYL